MFTGIITEKGKISSIEESNSGNKISIESQEVIKDKKLGQSIAINGVCCTITAFQEKGFTIFASIETLEVSNFDQLKKNDIVNLEAALKMGDSLDGHMVQGHVDAVGTLKSLDIKEKITLTIEFPPEIAKYIAPKGSITINGISLTVATLSDNQFTVELIPLTIEKTNLKELKPGDKVNLETDMIARYLERLQN